jgi:hypothetical protein
MAIKYNRRTTGLYSNGGAQNGTSDYFGIYNYSTSDSLSNGGCFAVDYNVYGSTGLGSQYIAVDTSKNYQHAVSVKGTSNNYNNNPPGGHLGFSCYDENFSFIDLRNCKGLGDTTLTRAATPGDTSIYVASASGWSTSTTNSQRGMMLFGGDYPYSGGYSRYTVTSNFYSTTGLTDLGGGEWRIDLVGTLPTWTNALVGGVYPVGTYVANGRAGGTYNYCHGNPNHPLASGWITYTTGVFTGESRNSSIPFRYGTKFIRFMNLRNYNTRTETSGDSARYLVDNIIFVERPDGTALPTSFLSSDRIR